IPASALHAALTQVAFERVRITLRREDGSIALDTVVLFPAGEETLTLSLNVPLPANTPASGVSLSLNLGYVNAAGDTVFKGGPVPVIVTPTVSGSGGTPPTPVQVPVSYTGPGAAAATVEISPRTASGTPGQTVTFRADARSASGQTLPGTPIVYVSSSPTIVTVDPTSGVATFVGRGEATVFAQLLTGPVDGATVTVTLPAARLDLTSGGGQTAPAGTTLAQPVVAKVTASDGIGVGGVSVTFAASDGGTATPATAVSDASGNVSTQWKLGAAAKGQTLTVTSAGLTGSPITVDATAQAVTPTRLVIQTGPVSGKAAVPLAPITVAAQDNGGNVVTTFVGDVTVALGANPGAATLGGTTTIKAVDGVATFSTLTLDKPGAGYTLVFSSASLSSAASSTFDISAGDVAALAFGPLPSSVDAGLAIAPPITVAARDAAGNAVTSFTGAITLALGANPGATTLGGTLTRSAVAGVATFDNLTLNKAAVGYTLTAASAPLTSATSTAFSVMPGTPTALTLVSGGGQSAAAGSPLSPIEVQLHDAFGNGISGQNIAFAVTGGGGSLSSVTGVTDATGTAQVVWTIGAGPQSMTATFTGVPPLTVTATSTSVALTWTGAVSADWNTAGNWSPAFVPSAADAVTIPVTGTAPSITVPATALSVALAPGASLTNNSTLTLTGSLDAGTTIVGSGSVVLSGASGTLKGVINQPVTVTGAAYALSGVTQINGSLTVSSTGMLTIGGQTLTLIGNFATSGGGRLAMTNAADVVSIKGNATFAGGSESGFLTAGTLSLTGNFTATGTTFAASGSHTLKLTGASAAQTLSFSSPLSGQGINHLTFEGAGAKTMAGTPQVMGNVGLASTSAAVDGAVTVKIGGNFADATILPDSGGYPSPQGGWRVANTTFFGSAKTINSTFISSNVTVSGTLLFEPCTSCYGPALYASLLATDGYVHINGDLTVAGAGAALKIGGNEVDVYGNFATASGGTLILTEPSDYLHVTGSATFGGGSTSGKLTNGTIEVLGNFTQNGAADSFAPSAGVYTYIGQPLYGALRASRSVRSSIAERAVPRSSAMEAARAKRMKSVEAFRSARAERYAKLDRRAAAYASRGLAAPPARGSVEEERAVGYRRARKDGAIGGTSVITFANPTSSFFGELYLSGPETALASDVLVTGELETGYSAWHHVFSTSTASRKIASHGADVRDLGFDNVSWVVLDGSDIWSMDYVEFANMDPTTDQFTITRTSDERALCDCTSYYELYYWSFATTPTTGHYIKATDTNGGQNVLELYMQGPSPSAHGGHIATSGGALISNWPETSVVTWLGGTSNDWTNASNWSGSKVPTSSDDVLIPSGTLYVPTTDIGAGYAHHLTIANGAHIQTSCYYELFVYGNVVAPLDAPAVTTCEGDAIHLMGDGTPGGNTVVGNFEMLKVEGPYKVSGPGNQIIVNLSWGSLDIDGTNGGVLTLNGGRVDANRLSVYSGGLIEMTNAADQLFIGGDNALFMGASTAGKLTAGTITVNSGGCLTAGAGAGAFAPSGTNTVVFASSNCVDFEDPLTSYFQNVTVNDGASLSVDTDDPTQPGLGFTVNGTLSRGPGTGVTTISAGYPYTPRVINVSGLNVTGAPTAFADVGLRFLAGTSNATFNTVIFTGFAGYTQPILTVTRPTGTVTFNSLDFSAVTGLATGGVYVANTNSSVTLNILSSLPSASTRWSGFNVNWP
ncbi:MAG: hypothetical protein HYV19_11950, partial [Gemmatimonadetes bacterium]|nr:hypothetical protein [Gemmatimonadota bacterium]